MGAVVVVRSGVVVVQIKRYRQRKQSEASLLQAGMCISAHSNHVAPTGAWAPCMIGLLERPDNVIITGRMSISQRQMIRALVLAFFFNENH